MYLDLMERLFIELNNTLFMAIIKKMHKLS